MTEFYVKKGQGATFSKTVSESDVYLFAGITGDFSPNHVNKAYMEKSSYGRLMAHGALLVGFMSTVSTMAIAHTRDAEETPVSVGYDKVRFLEPVFLGDPIPCPLMPESEDMVADFSMPSDIFIGIISPHVISKADMGMPTPNRV